MCIRCYVYVQEAMLTSPLELKQRMDDQSRPTVAEESFQALTMEGMTPNIVMRAVETN